MKKDITDLFVFLDDFCGAVDQHLSHLMISCGERIKKVTRVMGLTLSELLTIELLYQQSPCKNFKYFYHSYLQLYRGEFPNLVSYHRFVELKPRILSYLMLLVRWFCEQSDKTGLMQPLWLFVIANAWVAIKCSKVWRDSAKQPKAGSLA